MINEEKAWGLLEFLWLNPAIYESGCCHVLGGYGICVSIQTLASMGIISNATHKSMIKKISKEKEICKVNAEYLYECYEEGAKIRSLLCFKFKQECAEARLTPRDNKKKSEKK